MSEAGAGDHAMSRIFMVNRRQQTVFLDGRRIIFGCAGGQGLCGIQKLRAVFQGEPCQVRCPGDLFQENDFLSVYETNTALALGIENLNDIHHASQPVFSYCMINYSGCHGSLGQVSAIL